MITYTISVTEFNEDFVKYNFDEYENSCGGMTGRKWFPYDLEVGQDYQMVCNGALVKSVTRI